MDDQEKYKMQMNAELLKDIEGNNIVREIKSARMAGVCNKDGGIIWA